MITRLMYLVSELFYGSCSPERYNLFVLSHNYSNINFPIWLNSVFLLSASIRIFDPSTGSYRSGSKGNSFNLVCRIILLMSPCFWKHWGKWHAWLTGKMRVMKWLSICYYNFKWISGFTAYHPQEHSSKVCSTSWEVLAARSNIKTWFLWNNWNPAAVSEGGITRPLYVLSYMHIGSLSCESNSHMRGSPHTT